ncbi:MAG: hypothetical protein KDJ37_16350 [Hyphomicrobiaceae bacterium]|nr:hypothetical protein [Hyphomicrobiaceae bacterium]
MAQIFNFSAHAPKSGTSVRRDLHRSGSAEIVIFPGVRYERVDDGGKQGGKRRAHHRDFIDLPD